LHKHLQLRWCKHLGYFPLHHVQALLLTLAIAIGPVASAGRVRSWHVCGGEEKKSMRITIVQN